MSLLEERASDLGRLSWQRDLIFLSLWTLWLMIMVSFELPMAFRAHGLPLLVVFGSLRWGLRWGAVYLLIASFIFSSFSLIPSGLIWLAVFLSFLLAKLLQLQFNFLERRQLATLVILVSIVMDSFCLALMFFSGPADLKFSGSLVLFILSVSVIHGIMGFALFSMIKQIAGFK